MPELYPIIEPIEPMTTPDPVEVTEHDWRPKGPQPDPGAIATEMERHRVNIDKTGKP